MCSSLYVYVYMGIMQTPTGRVSRDSLQLSPGPTKQDGVLVQHEAVLVAHAKGYAHVAEL